MQQYVEIADIVFIDPDHLALARFFDGRVRGDGFDSFTLSLSDFEKLEKILNPLFIGLVRTGNPSLKSTVISHAESNTNELKEVTDGLELEIKVGDDIAPSKKLSAMYAWNSSTDIVTVTREEEYNITWGEWLLWIQWVKDFNQTILAYKGGL